MICPKCEIDMREFEHANFGLTYHCDKCQHEIMHSNLEYLFGTQWANIDMYSKTCCEIDSARGLVECLIIDMEEEELGNKEAKRVAIDLLKNQIKILEGVSHNVNILWQMLDWKKDMEK